MKGICFLCDWDLGRLHEHHIIPLYHNGIDTKNNISLLCPNHHTEAHILGHIKFNQKYNLTGIAYTEEQLKVINWMALFYYKMINSDNLEGFVINNKRYVKSFLNIMKKAKLDEYDLMARIMGLGRKQFIGIYT